MDHCPRRKSDVGDASSTIDQAASGRDPVLALGVHHLRHPDGRGLAAAAIFGPELWQPTFIVFAVPFRVSHGPRRAARQSADLARDQPRQQSHLASLLQVRGICRGEPQCTFCPSESFSAIARSRVDDAAGMGLCSAGRHLVLHLPVDELHDRLLPGQGAAGAQLSPLCNLRLLLPAVDGRADRAGQADASAVAARAALQACESYRRLFALPRRPLQETCFGQLSRRSYVDRIYKNDLGGVQRWCR